MAHPGTTTDVEDQLSRCRWVAHAVVFGEGRPYRVALITLDDDAIRQAGIPCAHACELVDQHVERVNETQPAAERIRRHLILDRPFTVADGELTPELAVRRDTVASRYAGMLDYLYEN